MLRSCCSRLSWDCAAKLCSCSASRSSHIPARSSGGKSSSICSKAWSTPRSEAFRAQWPVGSGVRSIDGTTVSQTARRVSRCASVSGTGMRRPLLEARQLVGPFQNVTAVSILPSGAPCSTTLSVGVGGRQGYLSIAAAISVCLFAGQLPKQKPYDVKTSAALPGPAFEAVAGPLRIADWVTHQRAAEEPVPAASSFPGKLELVGHDPLMNRGMNAAIAVHGRYVYVGSRTDGTHPNSEVFVVDVADPAKPSVVGRIGRPNEANVGESSRELRVLPDQNLLLVLNHGCSELIHACANATQAGKNIVTSTIRFYDIAGANGASPKLVATYTPTRTEAQTPHEFFLWSDPRHAGRVLMYETAPSTEASGKQNLYVVDTSKARSGVVKKIRTWNTKIGAPAPHT